MGNGFIYAKDEGLFHKVWLHYDFKVSRDKFVTQCKKDVQYCEHYEDSWAIYDGNDRCSECWSKEITEIK